MGREARRCLMNGTHVRATPDFEEYLNRRVGG